MYEIAQMDAIGMLTKNYLDYCNECEKQGKKAKNLLDFLLQK